MIEDTAVGQAAGYQDPPSYAAALSDVRAAREDAVREDRDDALIPTVLDEARAIAETIDWTDALEAAAIVLLTGGPRGHYVIEEALSNANALKGQAELGYTWGRQEAAQRQRYRRMADGIARAAADARGRRR